MDRQRVCPHHIPGSQLVPVAEAGADYDTETGFSRDGTGGMERET